MALLTKRGVTANATNSYGGTCLISVFFNGRLGMVEELLRLETKRFEVDLAIVNKKGKKALENAHHARNQGRHGIVNCLRANSYWRVTELKRVCLNHLNLGPPGPY